MMLPEQSIVWNAMKETADEMERILNILNKQYSYPHYESLELIKAGLSSLLFKFFNMTTKYLADCSYITSFIYAKRKTIKEIYEESEEKGILPKGGENFCSNCIKVLDENNLETIFQFYKDNLAVMNEIYNCCRHIKTTYYTTEHTWNGFR